MNQILNCSNQRLDYEIEELKQQIAAATAEISRQSVADMGNQIDQGLPMPNSVTSLTQYLDDSLSLSARTSTTTATTNTEGDLIQF